MSKQEICAAYLQGAINLPDLVRRLVEQEIGEYEAVNTDACQKFIHFENLHVPCVVYLWPQEPKSEREEIPSIEDLLASGEVRNVHITEPEDSRELEEERLALDYLDDIELGLDDFEEEVI